MNVFWPHNLKYQVNVNAILILENCTAHGTKQCFLSTCIGIKLLPPKITSRHQPADMRIIESSKVGYKSLYLWNIFVVVLKGRQYQGSDKEEDTGEYNMVEIQTCWIV